MKYLILISLILILSSGCAPKDSTTDISRPYIKSSSKLNSECTSIIMKLLEPTKIGEYFDIIGVYSLNIELDSMIYHNSEFEEGTFVGIKLRDDTVSMQIYCILPQYGAIYMCHEIESGLIVRNGNTLFNMTNKLKDCDCFEFDSLTYFKEIIPSTVGIWESAGSSELNGLWRLNSDLTPHFNNEDYNFDWNIHWENETVTFIKGDEETIKQSIRIIGDSLIFKNKPDTLNILTYTNNCIVLKRFDSDEIHHLNKITAPNKPQ